MSGRREEIRQQGGGGDNGGQGGGGGNGGQGGGDTSVPGGQTKVNYYADDDKDGHGFGDPQAYVPGTEPYGWVTQGDDNCPHVYNLDQADTDGDGQGDACEPEDTTTWVE
jgi:hypothetical protein